MARQNLICVQVEVALGSTILFFLVPQVPEEFCRVVGRRNLVTTVLVS